MSHSEKLFKAAQAVIPGGVNSPVRAFTGVGGTPLFFTHGQGAYITDVDDKTYIDYVMSWGPLILGHAHPEVVAAVHEASLRSLSFGAPTPIEVEMAQTLCELIPSLEKVRMVNSGTEATLSAIRLARGFTGRDKILKFEGCYHGHHDALLVKAGSGLLTFGAASSAGIPASYIEHTLIANYNDLASVEKIFAEMGEKIAAVIVEPVAANMNCVLPLPGFLQGLRKICDTYQSVLIFDEVITGFRLNLGGAQAYYNVIPDLTTLGKIVGGGLPVGAFGGKRKIMQHLAPEGAVYQAGTLSGNPVTLAAGLATIKELGRADFYTDLAERAQYLTHNIVSYAKTLGIPMVANHVGGLFGLFFTDQPHVSNFAEVMRCDAKRYQHFFHGMLEAGIYLAPSAFECGFVSDAHQVEELDITIETAEKVLRAL